MSTKPDLDLERGTGVRLLPRDFFDVLTNRFFPVLSLTYIASIVGVALKERHPLTYTLLDSYAYDIALWAALWVSVPALFWIVIRNSLLYAHTADLWYKAISALMVMILGVSFILFPETEIGEGVRIMLVTTLPVFVIQYYLFVRGGLPAVAAWPLSVAGIVMFLYGQLIL